MHPEPLPHLPLLLPVGRGGDRPEVQFPDRVASGFDRRQEENLLLNVGREVEQVHDLRHPGAGDVPEAGELGVVAGERN